MSKLERECGQSAWDEAGVEDGSFDAFRQIVAALRGENGCPWDKEQTFESLKPCMINELTEVMAAINLYKEEMDSGNLCEELGDLLLQVVLLTRIAEEEGLFRMEDVIRGISQKMIRRHPHVFPNPEMEKMLRKMQEEDTENTGMWELIKRTEKKDRSARQKQKERTAFAVAAEEVIEHLTAKNAEK